MTQVNQGIMRAIEIVGSRKKLADKIGVTGQTVFYWQKGVTMPSPQNLAKIILATDRKIKPWDVVNTKEVRLAFGKK